VNLSEIWIRRPVMTTLVTTGLFLLGILGYRALPVNLLPEVDFPTITVSAFLPGASPEVMASTVATPLEKQLATLSGVDSMSSTSTLGQTSIAIQFSLERNIDAAALDVNAALQAATGLLPKSMPNPPTFVKVNPGDMPIVMLALTSETLSIADLNDVAENVVMPNLSAVNGVAQVDLVPPQKRAVRVQLSPDLLAARGIGIDDVARALQDGNVNLPGGTLDGPETAWTLDPAGQLPTAADFSRLVVAWQEGNPVRIRDLGRAVDGIQLVKAHARYLSGGTNKPAVVLRVRKLSGANTVRVAEEVKSRLPKLRQTIPANAELDLFYDQAAFVRESIRDVQWTLVLTVFLVVGVILLFLGAVRPTVVPALVVPLSILGTFPVMSLLGYTLNNLSLMALTLAVGFVVDDAVVVLENVVRRIEEGEAPMEASLRGSREIGFTVLSMTVSLAVVFVPILFMSGILGRLFREFAVCITVAIVLSGILSLTLTPMLCSRLLSGYAARKEGARGPFALFERAFASVSRHYESSLRGAMRHKGMVLVATLAVTAAAVLLYRALPAGFIPQQDQGFFRVFSQVEDRTSFAGMVRRQEQMEKLALADPDLGKSKVVSVVGALFENQGILFAALPPRDERTSDVDGIIARFRPKVLAIPGLIASLVNPPLIAIGSRMSSAQWQYTLQSTDLPSLWQGAGRMEEGMRKIPQLVDVVSDLQLRKPQLTVAVDRDKASSLGLTLKQVQDAFFSAFGERQVSVIYSATNFYYVILELEPRFREDPSVLSRLYVRSSTGSLVPLAAVARVVETVAPLSVNHAGQMPSATVSFNLKPGAAIGAATAAIEKLAAEVLPRSVTTSFQGSAKAFRDSISSMGFLLLVTLVVIYLVLGILYESFVHPLTILSALPLAGFGALAALWLLGMQLDLYAYVGIILLVGIVKKNGIMMIDFALDAERGRGLSAAESIVEAASVRFRPIMMTTLAALFGTLPIALGLGAGGEARQSLGVAVVGGLLFSQLLTLYVTPVLYVEFDRLAKRRGASAKGER